MTRELTVDWPWPGEWESVEDVSAFYKDRLYPALSDYIGGLAESDTYIDYVQGPFTIANLTIGSVMFAGTGGLITQDNDDFFWDATNIRLGINVGTSPSVTLDVGGDCKFDGAVTINDAGADKDTRIEGLNDTELLFIDASTDRVGISTTAPTTTFNVAGDTDLDGSVIINESNADKDFRVEGSGATYTHLLFTDASTNRVGINLSSPLCLAHIRGTVCADYAGIGSDTFLLVENDDNVAIQLQAATTGTAFIEFADDNYNPPAGRVGYDFANEQMEFVVGTNERMWLSSGGTLSIDEHFQLLGAGAQIQFTGTAGGNGEGILYKDSGSTNRYGLLFAATNVVALCNRAQNGVVQLRANTNTAGAGGETTIVTVEDTDVTLADGIGFNLQEDITFSGATTENLIKIPDNLPVALDVTEAGNSYLKFVTTNSGEKVVFGKLFEAPTACKIGNLTLGDGSITDSSNAINFGNEALSTTGTLGAGNTTLAHLALGGASIDADYGINYEETLTDTDNSAKIGGRFRLLVAKTAAEMTSNVSGLQNWSILAASNTQNWTATIGLHGLQGIVAAAAGSSGTVTGMACLHTFASVGGTAANVTNLYGLYVQNPSIAATKLTNYYGIYVDHVNDGTTLNYAIYTNTGQIYFGDNVGIAQTSFGTNATKTLALSTGVAPTTSPADCFQMYSADIGAVAGKAGAHFRDEEGNVVSIGSGGMLMTGTARVTKQIILSSTYLERGSTAPDVKYDGNFISWEYDVGDDSTMTHIVPADWASGTDMILKVHWYIDEDYASDEEIKWQIDWAMCPHDESELIDAPTHSGTLTATSQNTPTNAKELTETTVGTITAANIAVGDELGLKLTRIAQDGDAPTAHPRIVHLEVVYTADKLGTAT